MGLRRRGTRRRVGIVVLIIPLEGPKNLAKNSLLFLIGIFRGTRSYRRGTNRIVSRRRNSPLGRIRHRWRWRRLGAKTKKLFKEVTLVRGHVIASLSWFGSS